MAFPIKEVIGSAATLIVAWLSYSQWLRGRRSGQYLTDRERAYNEIWIALETANLSIRTDPYTRENFREMLRATNALVLRHGLYFDEADQARIGRYLAAMEEVGRVLTADRADRVFQELRTAMYTTASGIDLGGLGPEYLEALRELDESRRAVVRAFQDHIGRPYA
jgi:hypothetical protein